MKREEKIYDVEVGFISKLIETKDIKTVQAEQIKDYFFTGQNKVIFKFINDYYIEVGDVPTARYLNGRYPSFKFEKVDGEAGTEESMVHWCREIRNKHKYNTLVDTLESTAEFMQNLDTEGAIEHVKKKISYIDSAVSVTSSVDIRDGIEERKKRYLEKKITKGITGIPTGFPSIDRAIGGLNDSTHTLIMARSGSGKTFTEVIMGARCIVDGYSVLQFATEMDDEIMRDRYEAVLFSLTRGDLNYGKFKSGSLSPELEEEFFDFLDNDLPNFAPLTILPATGVMGARASIELLKPDVVFIDGLYMMDDDRGAKEDWAKVTNISRDLKKLSKTMSIPIVSNTQTDLNSKGGMSGVKYAQALIHDADTVIELWRDEVLINDREMEWRVIKNREGVPAKIITNWDFRTMNFDEVYSEGLENSENEDSAGEVEDETVIGLSDEE